MPRSTWRNWLFAGGALLVLLLTTLLLYMYQASHRAESLRLLDQLRSQHVSIAVYYPSDLPAGYRYNHDPKVVKANIFYFSVTAKHEQRLYISQQTIPATFDFQAFNKKLVSTDTFTTDAGTAIAGQAGANMVVSVRTTKNSWILINGPASTPLNDIEAVARSLELVER